MTQLYYKKEECYPFMKIKKAKVIFLKYFDIKL